MYEALVHVYRLVRCDVQYDGVWRRFGADGNRRTCADTGCPIFGKRGRQFDYDTIRFEV
jgi:hypothetical protein